MISDQSPNQHLLGGGREGEGERWEGNKGEERERGSDGEEIIWLPNSRKALLDIFGHVYLFSLLHIEICEIILTIGIKTPS